MTSNKLNSLGRQTRILGALLAIIAVFGYSASASAVVVTAGSVTVDGVKGTTEYNNGVSHGTESLLWFNDHHSRYRKNKEAGTCTGPGDPTCGDPNEMNTMFWEINGAADDWSLNLFVEVPDYARRMVWVGVDDKNGGYKYDGTNYDAATMKIDKDILDKYLAGATIPKNYDYEKSEADQTSDPHKTGVKMDYKTQTDSEYFQLNGPDLCFGLQDHGGHCSDKTYKVPDSTDATANDGIYWQTSRHYLIDTTMQCTTAECLADDTTMSIELMFRALDSKEAAEDIVTSITSLQLHLSDEAFRLDPITVIPVPAAFWLFGTALIGFIGISRRTNLA